MHYQEVPCKDSVYDIKDKPALVERTKVKKLVEYCLHSIYYIS
jgi:hypothetical protein